MNNYDNSFDPSGEVPETAIAIVGMSCRFAGVRGLDDYWALLRQGREAIETYSEEELLEAGVSRSLLKNRNYVRKGAPLQDMECFDAALFGLSPRDAAIMDPQHRHFLECAWEAFENAGHTPQRFGGVIGVFAGSGHNAYMPYNLLTNPGMVRDVGLFLLRHTGNDKDFLTTRVSYLFDLKGPSINVQTACSTSLVSIHMAAQSLLGGECDMALAGGASIELPHRQGYLFEEGEILSPDGTCRPFDAASKGTVFGSGITVVVLRRLADAIASGDHIYAVLRGSAINNDGATKVGYLAPSVDGQAKVIAEALAMADVEAGTISYVEAHGTGTPVGDPIEVAALTEAFRQSTDQRGQCAIGSVKGNIGHTDTAAGAAGVIKVALSLHHGELPPSLNFQAPNPQCAFESSPFRVQAELSAWTSRNSLPRRAGVSSLGVGGTNAHVVLEEAPPRLPGGPSRRRQILLCSGETSEAARANGEALARHFTDSEDVSLPDAAYTLAMGRQHLKHRRFAVAGNAAEAAEQLGSSSRRDKMPVAGDRRVAFLFSGAGPQHVDMARGLYETEPAFRTEVDNALAVLERISPVDVGRWLFPSEADRERAKAELERPSIALPALFIIQTSLARLWMANGIPPAVMIGHSSGEYAAAHIAGVIDLEAGLRIVSTRGRLFETVSGGGMLSVTLAEEELAPLLPPTLSIAAINAPSQCVVSGPVDAIARFHEMLTDREVEAQAVRIAVAAHSPMLDPILPEFRSAMQGIALKAPRIPFASNLTGDWVREADVTDPEYWVRHLRETVRFTDGLRLLLDDPDLILLEVGPGRSMTSLARQQVARQERQAVLSSLRHPDQSIEDDAFFLDTLGQLWALGVPVDWDAFWKGERRHRVPLPTYQFERRRHWIEPGAAAGGASIAGSLARNDDVADWRYDPVWTRALPVPTAVPEGPALVLEDDTGLGRRIAERLRDAGRDVVIVRPGARYRQLGEDRFTVAPDSAADYARLLDRLNADGRLPSQVYHCWLVTGGGRSRPPVGRLLDCGLHSLAALAPELARRLAGTPAEFALVTDGAQRVSDERRLVPVKATALGIANVVSSEYPDLRVRAIDFASSPAASERTLDGMADAVLRELGQEPDGKAIAYRAGERWVLDYKPAPIEGGMGLDRARLRTGGTYAITGGLGGLGLAIALHLAQDYGASLALIARNDLPPRERWGDLLSDPLQRDIGDRIRAFLAIEATGVPIELIVADVADRRAMRRAMRKVCKRLGPITGVFHAAGTLEDGLLETKTRASIEAVLRPKLGGTLAIEAALKDHPPEFMVLFSSVSAFAGLAGQADYAAANAFLDSYAQSRHADPVTEVISIGWSRWNEIGMAARLTPGNGGSSLPEELGEGDPVDHPFLDRLHMVSADEYLVSATLSPEEHWLLDEHRLVDGSALLPGTAYLELVRAAHGLINPGFVVLSDVTFLSPFTVADGSARQLRVHLRRRVGDDWRFAVMGRPLGAGAEGWVEHAVGLVSVNAAADARAAIDVGELRARCPVPGSGVEEGPVNFGRHWSNVERLSFGTDEALLDLAAPAEFHDEYAVLALHPALLDFATAGAQMLIPGRVAGRDFFVPYSYRSFATYAPLPPRAVSHVRYRAAASSAGLTAVFDVSIADADGRVIAEITEFTMLRVRDTALMSQAAGTLRERSQTAAASSHDDCILPEEGIRVLGQLLSAPSRPHVIVSPQDLGAALARLRAPVRVVREERAGEVAAEDLPRTATEQVIADLWSDLLGVVPVRRHDNFFDLGGHSLLAVQFANRLRKETGRTLPLAALLDTPTVAHLAETIDPGGAAAMPSGDPIPLPVAPAREVVTIRPGGTLTPIFFVHDGLGETLLYRGLALRLDPGRPVYGIEPLRSAAGNFAHTRIHEMATNYIERMRTVQPTGPYLIAGLCAGGVIAFEMARQLRDLGETVALVAIIDAADVAAAKRRFHIARARLVRLRGVMKGGNGLAVLPELGRRAANALSWEIGSRIRQARDFRTVQKIREANSIADGPADRTRPEEAISFLKLYEVAHKLHRPDGLFEGGTVVVFKAQHDTGEPDDLPYQMVYRDFALGWGRRVAGDLVIADVPGGHSSALQEPNVATLAPLFQDAIDCAMERFELQAIHARENDVAYPVAAE